MTENSEDRVLLDLKDVASKEGLLKHMEQVYPVSGAFSSRARFSYQRHMMADGLIQWGEAKTGLPGVSKF